MNWDRTKKLFRYISLLLFVAIAGGFVALQTQGGKLFSVQSGSMVPALEKGDLTVVTRVPEGQLAVGDIVTFINPENTKQTITHRIIATPSLTNGQEFITKGDANTSPDAPINGADILGAVQTSVPYAGSVIDFLRTPIGLLLIVYLPALLIVIEEIRRLSDHYRRMQPYVARVGSRLKRPTGGSKWAMGAKFVAFFVLASALFVGPVQALLSSQAVLTSNTISTAPVTPPPNSCSGSTTNNNNVNVTNNNSQTATSGDATNSSNTNGGSATSGNASNSSSTNVNITVNNC